MKNFRHSKVQRGLTLIEVLIALLVLSIGLVGIALLHVKSLQFAHSSYYASVASAAALDLEERLWVALASRQDGCLDSQDVEDVLDALEGLWVEQDPARVAVPGMQIQPRTAVFTPLFTEVPITLAWTDARFVDPSANSTFSFSARTVCFEPEDDDDEDDP